MKRSWTIVPPTTPPPDLVTLVGGHPLIAQLLAQRGFDTPEKVRAFLDPSHYAPTPPTALLGVTAAAQLLHDAIQAKKNIINTHKHYIAGQDGRVHIPLFMN